MFKTVSNYIRRSPYQALAASLIMTLTLFMVSIFLYVMVASGRMIYYFETRPQLTIFFNNDTNVSDIMKMKQEIQNTGKVAEIRYVSNEEALKIYKNLNKGEDPLLNELVTADILPSSLDVRVTSAEYLKDIYNKVKNSKIVYNISFPEEVINTLITYTSTIRKIGIVVISILLFQSIVVIVTIIGMKIIIRREEIEIMRLIGATNWFIRLPFILEGMFYGVIGAFIGGVIAYGLVLYFSPTIQSYFSSIPIFPLPLIQVLQIFVVEFILAIMLGAFASFIAVLRYLR